MTVAGAVVSLVAALLLWPVGPQGARAPAGKDPAEGASAGERQEGVRRWSWRRAGRARASARPRPGPGAADWAADLADLAALALEAGLPPDAAADLAIDLAGPPRGPATEGVAFLAAAWSLADDLGAPAAGAARTCALVLRDRAAAQGRRRTVEAGPRASMWLLTMLPLGGPLVGVMLGLPVAELYGRPAALASAGLGGGLTALGWWWSRALLRRAARPSELGG